MTYEDIVSKVQKQAITCDAGHIDHHIAVQFNIFGEGEGAFFIEIGGGRVIVQPFEYYDRDAVVYVDAQTLLDTLSGKLEIADVASNGKMVIQGNYDATIRLLECFTRK